MKRVIIVAITDEIKTVADLTLPKLRDYARRCNAELIVLDGLPEKYQHPKYRMFEAAEIKADRYLIVDTDIVVRDSAPNIFEALPEGNYILDELETRGNHDFRLQWDEVNEEHKTFPLNWWSPGVCLLDREAVQAIYQMPPWDAREKMYTAAGCKRIIKNMPWINRRIQESCIEIRQLPQEWNCFVNTVNDLEHANFWHCAGAEIRNNVLEDKTRIIHNVCNKFNEPLYTEGYSVNFVMAKDQHDWILGKMQRAISDNAHDKSVQIECTVAAIDKPGVVNLYWPYRGFRQKSKDAVDIVFCTHPELEELFYVSAKHADAVITMCKQYTESVQAVCDDPDKVHCVYPGVDDRFINRKMRIFNPSKMTATPGYRDRKGLATWQRLQEIEWLECICSDGKMSEQQVYDEYMKADVIVSTSTMEGGPMCALEGAAMYKLVLARAGVGLVNETENITGYDTDDDLIRMLEVFYHTIQTDIKPRTWQQYAADIWRVIERYAEKTRIPIIKARQTRQVQRHAKKDVVTVFSELSREARAWTIDYFGADNVEFVPNKEDANVVLVSETCNTYFNTVREIQKQLKGTPYAHNGGNTNIKIQQGFNAIN